MKKFESYLRYFSEKPEVKLKKIYMPPISALKPCKSLQKSEKLEIFNKKFRIHPVCGKKTDKIPVCGKKPDKIPVCGKNRTRFRSVEKTG